MANDLNIPGESEKSRTLFKILVWVLLIMDFIFPGDISAQHYSLHYFGQKEDLKYARSRNVVKDRQGYLWFAGENGIMRFDGKRFVTFNSGSFADVNVPVNNVHEIFLLKNGELAMREKNTNVGIFNPETFRYKNLDLNKYIGDDKITRLFPAGDSLLYICLQSVDSISVLSFDGDHPDKVYGKKSRSKDGIELHASYQNPLYFIPFDKDHYLYFEAGFGYFIIDKKSGNLKPLKLPNKLKGEIPWPNFITRDQQDNWLISFNQIPGMFTLEKNHRIVRDDGFDKQVEYRFVNPGGNGKLIFSAYKDSAMYFVIYNPKDQSKKEVLKNRYNSWSVRNAWSENADRYLYVCGDGIAYAEAPDYDISSFLVNAPQNTRGYSIRGMAKLNDHDIMISAEHYGLFIYNDSAGSATTLPVPDTWPDDLKPVAYPRNMLTDKQGKIYIGAWDNVQKGSMPGGYLLVYDPEKGFEKYYKLPFRIQNIVWESDTSVLAAAPANLFRIGLFPEIHLSHPITGISDGQPVDLFIQKMTRHQDEIYLATDQGLFRFDAVKGLQKVSLPGARVNRYLDVFAGPDSLLWIGTNGDGLYRYNKVTGALNRFGYQNGFSSDIVCGILPADSNHLWISTYNGLYRFNTRKGFARMLRNPEGFPHNEFNRFSYLKIDSQTWLFGSLNGFIRVEQVEDVVDTDNRNIMFSSLACKPEGSKNDTVFYSLEQRSNTLKLSAYERRLRISFGLLQPQLTGSPPIYYRLVPLQYKWREMPGNSELDFNYIPPGNYRLELSLDNSDDTSATVIFNFKAAYFLYELWWFQIAVFILIVVIIGYLIYLFFDRRMAKESERKIRENETFKQRLFTYITHEFKTPLTVITGVSDKLVHSGPGDTWEENIVNIHRQSAQMNALVEQMMELNRIDAGSWVPEMVAVDIPVFAGRLCAQLQSLADEMKIRLECSSTVQSSFQLTDVSRLRAILNNLISNAMKFSPEESAVSLSYEVGEMEWSITVRDRGPGISDGDKAHIFELFYKGKNPSAKRMTNSGVGLAYVKTTVAALNGKMEVSNDNGAVFKVIFPASDATMLHDDQVSDDTVEVEPSGEPGREVRHFILLVEDSVEIAQYVRSCFDLKKFSIHLKKNGREGLVYARENIPDLVITDARMPEMNGFELCRRLKREEITAHIPVIMLTALSGETNRLKGLEAGADAYVVKPFNEQELIFTVSNILQTIAYQKKHVAGMLTGNSPDPELKDNNGIPDSRFIKKVNHCLELNYTNSRFGIAEMAEQLNLSRAQMRRKLISIAGLNPSDMLRIFRLNRAAKMLLDKSMSISEIAYVCGFNDPSYFSKAFHKEFGQSPTAYRDSIKN